MLTEVEQELLELVEVIEAIPEADKKNVCMFVEHNEVGVALDSLCHQLYEYNIAISAGTLQKLMSIVERIGVSLTTYDFLKELVV